MKELLIRSVFGLLFLAVVFVPIVLDLRYELHTFNFVLLLFSLIGTAELFRMAKENGTPSALKWLGFATNIAFFFPMLKAAFAELTGGRIAEIPAESYDLMTFSLFVVVVGSFCLFIAMIYRFEHIRFVFGQTYLLSIFYPLLPFALLGYVWTYNDTFERSLLIFVLLPIYLNDTLAYVSGRFLGKHKLFPSVSPKKTWEGFVGGMAGALAAMHLILYLTGNYDRKTAAMFSVVSILASVLATYGDLFESKLKRSAGVKDSGNILPGHGGILDRIDAMLFVAPVLYVLLTLIF